MSAGAILGLGIALGWFGRGLREADPSATTLQVDDAGPTLEQIQTLAALTTLRANVADAVVSVLRGRTGSLKAVLIVHGEVTLGVDLGQAEFCSVDAAARRAVLVLPRPRVQEVRLDPDRTKVVALSWSGLWLLVPGGENAQLAATHLAFQDAQRLVLQAAQDPTLVERSRRQTEAVLDSFFTAMTWSVEIRWSG
jgi:hypothetical protein